MQLLKICTHTHSLKILGCKNTFWKSWIRRSLSPSEFWAPINIGGSNGERYGSEGRIYWLMLLPWYTKCVLSWGYLGAVVSECQGGKPYFRKSSPPLCLIAIPLTPDLDKEWPQNPPAVRKLKLWAKKKPGCINMEEEWFGQIFEQIKLACCDRAMTWKCAIKSENCMFLMEGQAVAVLLISCLKRENGKHQMLTREEGETPPSFSTNLDSER